MSLIISLTIERIKLRKMILFLAVIGLFLYHANLKDRQKCVLASITNMVLSSASITNMVLSSGKCQPSDWRPGARGFNPRRGRQHSFVEIDHEIFSTVILSLPLIQEGQLSVSGERMCTILVNRLED